jgi:hypothetical protein
MKKESIDFIDDKNLSVNDDYYESAMIKMDHLRKKQKYEIKSSEPIQVRINNGEWIDVRSMDEV